jgi:3-polyprenyl-4-hydroxybenzoate decarboxylase
MENTAGQTFTKTIRRVMQIGPSTRAHRGGKDMQKEIVERINLSVAYGWDAASPEIAAALRPAHMPAYGYAKHIRGMRVSPVTCMAVKAMTPWQFTGLLGEMIDAKVTNAYEAELFFGALVAA